MEQLGAVVTVFVSGANRRVLSSIPGRAQKFVSIAACSFTASDLLVREKEDKGVTKRGRGTALVFVSNVDKDVLF